MISFWYVDTRLPDYPVEVTVYKYGEGGRYILFGPEFERVADVAEHAFWNKGDALRAAQQRIRARCRYTMHNEGMEDHDYDRSREWADGLIDAITAELEDGIVFDPQELANDLQVRRRESGRW